MAQNYTRQSTLSDGDTITASLFNDEYNQLVNAFTYSSTSESSTGHRHDGSAGQGGNIFKIGDLDFLNKIEVDSTNNRWGFYVEVSSVAVEQIRIQDGAVVPVTTNDIDLGTASLQFKDLYIDGTANVDSLTLTSGTTVTAILDEDDLSSDSATALVTQQSVKAYVDSQVTAQDLDFQGDTGGALSIDLDSESLTVAGGTGIDTAGSLNTLTVNIDSTVATLTGTQTFTNKTLTSPDVNTPDIDGGTIDGATIGGTTAAAGSFTTVSATGNITVGGTVDGRDVATDGTKLDGIEALADVTDTTNVTAAGALMDSELTNITAVKALDQGVATTDSPTFAGLTTTANVSFGDNDKAVFGAGSDLEIYHDGTESFIADTGTGSLTISGGGAINLKSPASENMIVATGNGSVDLYYDNSRKLRTASTGIDVTGTVTADGLTVDGNATINSASPILYLTESDTTDLNTRIRNAAGNYQIHTGNDALNSFTARMNISHSTGDISFYEDTGTTAKFFWDASAERLGIGNSSPATALDVTGTVTADGLTVDGGNTLRLNATSTTDFFTIIQGGTQAVLTADSPDGAGNMLFRTAAAGVNLDRMQIASGGDISFYEDTGTTAKLFWDASAESLGIGTSSPASPLTINGTDPLITFENGESPHWQVGFENTQSDRFVFYDNNASAYRMVIDSSGNVGIGTSSPAENLHISSSSGSARIRMTSADGSDNMIVFGDASDSATGAIRFDHSDNSLAFNGFNNTERMRIDSAGNVGIGTTSPAVINYGRELTVASLSGSEPEAFVSVNGNRTADGNLGAFSIANNGTTIAQVIGKRSGANNSGALAFTTASAGTNTERMRIDSSGNVDVGTESTGAGGTADKKIGVYAGGYNENNTASLVLSGGVGNNNTPSAWSIEAEASGTDNSLVNNLKFGTTSYTGSVDVFTERMRIDSSGNVAIGHTSANSSRLHLKGVGSAGTPQLMITDNSSGKQSEIRQDTSGNLVFDHWTGASRSERMRLDSSGNLLVGKTSSASQTTTVGHSIESDGRLYATRSGGAPLQLSRLSTDGNIASFYKDGATVGSIGYNSFYYIAGGASGGTHAGLRFVNNQAIRPCDASGDNLDNALDLGASTARFKDLYLSGGAYLGGTGSGNKLDDYEEGTWTPEIVGSTTAGSYSSTIKIGTYTKVGQVVTVWGYFLGSSGTGAGDLNISGLPFSLATDAVGVIQGNAGLVYPSGTADACLFGSGGTTLHVRCNKSDGTTYSKMAYPTSATYIRFTLSYRTA